MKQERRICIHDNLVRISIYSYLIIVISVIYNLSPVVLFFIFAKRTHIKSIATDSNKTIKYLKAIRSYPIDMFAFYCICRKYLSTFLSFALNISIT